MPADRTQADPTPRRLLGSEVIRKRVDQLLHSSTGMASSHPSAPYNQASSSRTTNRIFLADGRSKPQVEAHERRKRPASTSYSSDTARTERAENRPVPTANLSMSPSHICLHRPSVSMQYTISSESEHHPSVAPLRTSPKRVSKDTDDNNVGERVESTERHERRLSKSSELVFTGPLAVAEFARLKQEIETLKESLHNYKKMSRRDKKKLEECQTELTNALSKSQEKDSEISTLKANHKKAEETLATIEHTIQCQICMELPDNPFVLSPCGHTLCLPCLQEWFRKAPPALEDADIDPEELSDPQYILMRSKSCPSCRARVRRRPVPIFMVKAVASTLKNARAVEAEVGSGVSGSGSAGRVEEDPWRGIFQSSDEEDSEGDERELSESESEEENEGLLSWYPPDNDEDEWPGTGSEEEDEHEHTEYVPPHWAPPHSTHLALARVRQEHSTLPEETMKLLMRGCTLEMINNYTLSYQRHCGIMLLLPGRPLDHLGSSSDEDSEDDDDDEEGDRINYIFLGWNIRVAPDDLDGERFVDATLLDIRDNPMRWQITQRRGVIRGIDATRLVRREHAGEAYSSSDDSEIWLDAEDEES